MLNNFNKNKEEGPIQIQGLLPILRNLVDSSNEVTVTSRLTSDNWPDNINIVMTISISISL